MQSATRRSIGAATAGVLACAASLAGAQADSALERELLADAAARVSFQGGGSTAGHDGQFFLSSDSGDMRLWIGGMTQFRYTINNRDTTAPDEDLTTGFDFSRVKLYIGGKVRGNNEFFIRTGFNPSTGAAALEFAKMTHTFDNGVMVCWGQNIAPLLKEQRTSEKKFMSTERSLLHEVFSYKFAQGVEISYTDENFRVFGSVNDGRRTNNTAYFSTREADFSFVGRAEFRFGDAPWKSYWQATSFRETKTGGLIGGAVAYQTAGDTANTDSFGGTAPTELDVLTYTADFSYKGGGWTFFGAFLGQNTEMGSGSDFTDFGGLLQGSVYVHDQWEVFGRWDAIFPDDDRSAGEDFNVATLGVNHYFYPKSHAAKFTAELAYYMDDQAGSSDLVSAPNTRTNLLPSSEDSQWALRLQMQLVF